MNEKEYKGNKPALVAKLIGNTDKTVYKWATQNRPILIFLKKYFTDENIEEFLKTGNIAEFDYLYQYKNKLVSNIYKYLSLFTLTNSTPSPIIHHEFDSILNFNDDFIRNYFKFLGTLNGSTNRITYYKFINTTDINRYEYYDIVNYIYNSEDIKDAIAYLSQSNFSLLESYDFKNEKINKEARIHYELYQKYSKCTVKV